MMTLSCIAASNFTRRLWSIVAVLIVSAALYGCNKKEAAAPSESLTTTVDDTALEHAVKHLDPKYVCPMHPQIVRDAPGNCPICGINLVAKRIDADAVKRPIVTVRGEVIQSMGVRTAAVERKTPFTLRHGWLQMVSGNAVEWPWFRSPEST